MILAVFKNRIVLLTLVTLFAYIVINASEKKEKAKASWEEIPPAEMPLMNRLNNVIYTQINSTSNITSTSKMGFEILKEKFPPVLKRVTVMAELRKMMDEMDAPYTQERIPVWDS